jgi:myo-inositol 2-dehydrogenase/D-chiro-inositol 1-dehydrogenase
VHRNAVAQPGATSDGVIVNSMIHELDIVPWLLDDPLRTISVVAAGYGDGGFADLQVAVIETVSGAVVTIEVFVNAGYGYDVRCEIVGTSGTARLTPPYGLARRRAGADEVEVSADFVARFADAYRVELSEWANAAAQSRVEGPTAWDGHRANVAAAAGVDSRRSGTRVAIAQEEPPELYS